tara:strand:+ start:243 stop:914 length:672 start_codon:yes stop_codon:yes gene_type:complete
MSKVLKYWKWGYSKIKNRSSENESLVMEEIPLFPVLFIGRSQCGKEALFERVIGDRFSSTSTHSTGVLSGVRSITVGSGKFCVCCWSEVLCMKGDCFDTHSFDMLNQLWRKARGVVLIVDALNAFEYGNLEEQVEKMLATCKRIERDVLGCETQLLIVLTKCDLLPGGLTARDVFNEQLDRYGIDYIFSSSKNVGEGCVNPSKVMSILSRKMLEWHLNFEPKN